MRSGRKERVSTQNLQRKAVCIAQHKQINQPLRVIRFELPILLDTHRYPAVQIFLRNLCAD
jgi:hypothetical protein